MARPGRGSRRPRPVPGASCWHPVTLRWVVGAGGRPAARRSPPSPPRPPRSSAVGARRSRCSRQPGSPRRNRPGCAWASWSRCWRTRWWPGFGGGLLVSALTVGELARSAVLDAPAQLATQLVLEPLPLLLSLGAFAAHARSSSRCRARASAPRPRWRPGGRSIREPAQHPRPAAQAVHLEPRRVDRRRAHGAGVRGAGRRRSACARPAVHVGAALRDRRDRRHPARSGVGCQWPPGDRRGRR